MKAWDYIEKHHEDFGVALFVLPCLLATLGMAGVAFGLGLLLR